MKLTENDFARIAQLGRQGLNCQQIANDLHLHAGTVWTINKRLELGVPKGVTGSKPTWTANEDAALRDMVEARGMTIKDAAERLGRSTANTWKRCERLGIKARIKLVRWDQADEELVFALWQGGLTACAIAKTTGIDATRIRRKIRRWQGH